MQFHSKYKKGLLKNKNSSFTTAPFYWINIRN